MKIYQWLKLLIWIHKSQLSPELSNQTYLKSTLIKKMKTVGSFNMTQRSGWHILDSFLILYKVTKTILLFLSMINIKKLKIESRLGMSPLKLISFQKKTVVKIWIKFKMLNIFKAKFQITEQRIINLWISQNLPIWFLKCMEPT